MRCPNCPVRAGVPCRGETNPRHCQLNDPAHPDYTPAHRESLIRTVEVLANRPVPSLAQQAASLGRALFDWACSGFSAAPEDLQARRLETCHNCSRWEAGRCTLCGCYTAAKIRMKIEKCPEGRW